MFLSDSVPWYWIVSGIVIAILLVTAIWSVFRLWKEWKEGREGGLKTFSFYMIYKKMIIVTTIITIKITKKNNKSKWKKQMK